MNLAEKIYELRTKQNLSQGDLADLLEVSRQSISKWETGSSVPDLDKLIKLSEVFHVTLDELVLDRQDDSNQGNFTLPPKSSEDSTSKSGEQAPRYFPASPQTVAGIILLSMAFISLLFGSIHETAIIFLCFPLVICGVICLRCKHYPGLLCFWSIFFMIDLFSALRIGHTWSNAIFYIIIYHMTGKDGLYNIALLFSWGMLLYAITLISATVLLFKKKNFLFSKRICILINVGTGVSFLLPLILLVFGEKLSLYILPLKLSFLFTLICDIFLILLTLSLVLLFQYLYNKRSITKKQI